VLVQHKDGAARKRHEEMGLHEGRGKCLNQLMEVARQLRAARAARGAVASRIAGALNAKGGITQ